ncbi:MAG: STY4851/ECs_5259 family protein, partial [Novosphingobium sp.]
MNDDRRAWAQRLDEAETLEELDGIERQLAARNEPGFGVLRIKAIDRRRILKSGGAPRARSGPAVTSAAFAKDYGLPAPTGCWLYRYRLDTPAFERLQADLGRMRLDMLERGYAPGLFVLWASEWFRRCYRGGILSWAMLTQELSLPEDQNRLRALTRKGLLQWQRPVIHLSGRQYLGTLAREGGFPVAAIEEGGRGWARPVLEAIVAPMMGNPAAGEDDALILAQAAQGRVPGTFQDPDFLHLCADFAWAIVAIRREAEPHAIAAGVPVAAWLGLNRPGWREDLPLSAGDRAADALVDGLMKVEPVPSGQIGVQRLLVREAGQWREAARLELEGVVDGATMDGINPGEGRLRAFAAGPMVRHVPGELGLFEPPAAGEDHWVVRSTRKAQGILPLPFNVAIELDLRAGDRRVKCIALRKGKARRGQLLIGVAEDGTENDPHLLRIIGSGSGGFRSPTVFVQAPEDWAFTALGEEQAVLFGQGVGATRLWRVTGGASVTDPSGDMYRIRCGLAKDETSRLELVGDAVAWAEVSGNVDLFQGSPKVAPLRSGRLVSRALGTRAWQPVRMPLPVGHYELGWQDQRIMLDRRRIAVLPASATLGRSGRGNDAHYTLAGFGEIGLAPADDAPVRTVEAGNAWQAKAGATQAHCFSARLEWPDSRPLDVSIPFPCAASVARWDGTPIAPRTDLTLADMRDLLAVDAGRMELVGELRDPQNRHANAELCWAFDRELPLAAIADDVASLLNMASIDSSVRLGMHDGIEAY